MDTTGERPERAKDAPVQSGGGMEAEDDSGVARRRRVAEGLHSAAIHLLRRLRREDDASGLTAPRLSALSVVVFGGPIALGALAAAEQVRAPTMSRIVTALERAGLVARESSPADGRAVLVRATPAGRRVLEEGRARRTAVLARRLEELGAAEVATLDAAAALIERLASAPAPPAGAAQGRRRPVRDG